MQNTKLLLTSFTFVGLLALAGCSFPGVYKIDIQQGNVVTQDMINQLRPGMTRRQVRFIMGNALLTDTFHPARWDYLYSLQPGGGERQQERISVFFNENDQLVSLSGDFKPGVSRDEAILGKVEREAEPVAVHADLLVGLEVEVLDRLGGGQRHVEADDGVRLPVVVAPVDREPPEQVAPTFEDRDRKSVV